MPSDEQPIAAILAGGAGSRLGGHKPLVELGGRPLISYPVAAAREAGLDVVVVAKPGIDLPALDTPVLEESDPVVHPLAGLLAALDANPGRGVLALACDLPFLPPALLGALVAAPPSAADGWRAATIEVEGRMQPLIARYDSAAAPALRTALCRGEAANAALARLRPTVLAGAELERFGEPARIAFNVNTREDLEAAERMLADNYC